MTKKDEPVLKITIINFYMDYVKGPDDDEEDPTNYIYAVAGVGVDRDRIEEIMQQEFEESEGNILEDGLARVTRETGWVFRHIATLYDEQLEPGGPEVVGIDTDFDIAW